MATLIAVAEPPAPPCAAAPPPVAWRPIGSAVLLAVVALTVSASRYDYHRDELYFRMLKPAWGYVDQPPLTPLLARASIAIFGDSLWAIRIPATLCVAVSIVLVALTTRELGGGRRAQTISAWGFAFSAFPIIIGHILVTATVDLAVWAAVILFLVRAFLRANPRWWLAAGAVVGLSLFNKLLIGLLLVGLAIGLLAVGPRRVLRSPWLWAGAGLAVLLGLPTLIYQATHHWPQAQMAGVIAVDKGPDDRVTLLPFQLIMFGLPLVPIVIAGLVALFRRPQWRPVRAFAVAYLAVLVIVLVTGGQVYYPFGLLALMFAAGAVPTERWIADRPGRRRALVTAGIALNAAVSVFLGLPVVPLSALGSTPIPAINSGTRDQIGWPAYVRTVADVYSGLSPADAARAVIFVSNYGEAGAIDRYGPAYHLPPVYSGHNELYYYGPPPGSDTVVIVWTEDTPGPTTDFASCTQKATMDNGVGVDNEEQHSTLWLCRDPRPDWPTLWPHLKHLG